MHCNNHCTEYTACIANGYCMLADDMDASNDHGYCLQTPYGNKHSRQWQLLWWIIVGSAFIWLMTFLLGLRAGASPLPPPPGSVWLYQACEARIGFIYRLYRPACLLSHLFLLKRCLLFPFGCTNVSVHACCMTCPEMTSRIKVLCKCNLAAC